MAAVDWPIDPFPKILAVIPSINVRGHTKLEALYRSLLECEGLEPVIMSNSRRLTLALERSNLAHITQHANAGFANSVTYASTGREWDWLLIVNDDIELSGAVFQKAVREHLSRPASLESHLVYFDQEPPREIPRRIDVVLQVSLIGARLARIIPSLGPRRKTYRSFSCVAVSRALWEKVGGFDETLPFTYEDADFVRRAHEVGFREQVITNQCLEHKHSVSSGAHIASVLPVATYSGALYMDKWYGCHLLNSVLLTLALLSRIPIVPFARANKAAHLIGIVRSARAVWCRRASSPSLPYYEEL